MSKKNKDTTVIESSYGSIVKEASERDSNNSSSAKLYPAFIALVVMLFISGFIYINLEKSVRTKNQENFDEATASVMTRLTNHQSNLIEVVESVAGAYDLVIEVVSDFFMLFSTVPANNYESIISINYIPKVPANELGLYTYNAMSEGYYNYKVYPKDSTLDYYYPIKHVVPLNTSNHIQGFNVGTIPQMKEVIDIVPDSIGVHTTSLFDVRKDTTGFYFIKAVYHKGTERATKAQREENYRGFVGIEVDAKKYFQEALKGDKNVSTNAIATDETILFTVYEFVDGVKCPIYESENSQDFDGQDAPEFHSEIPFKVGDKTWVLDFTSVPNFGGETNNQMPLIVLVISILLTIAFFLFIISVLTGRARAQALAKRMTESQRRIVDASQDIIGVLDTTGKWKTINSASKVIFGYPSERMINTSIKELIAPDGMTRYESVFENLSKFDDNESIRIDFHMKNSENKVICVNWSLTISHSDGLIYAIGRDVTLEKEAAKEAEIRRKQIELTEQFTREISESKTLFMIKLSHHLRNSLTGMSGYLQMLNDGLYENEEEMKEFINEASQSVDELYTYTSDFVDSAIQQDGDSKTKLGIIDVRNELENIKKDLQVQNPKVEIEYKAECDVFVFADKELFVESLNTLFDVLSYGTESGKIVIQGVVNTYENAAELQISGPPSEEIHHFIEIYKENQNDLINVIDKDKDDVLLKAAIAASNVRRMSGSIIYESFGKDDGALVQLNLPMNNNISH